MVRERTEAVFRLLKCKVAEIARMAGCAPPVISRVRNGSRTYYPYSNAVRLFAKGVYLYADSTRAVEQLSSLCGAAGRRQEDVIPALIAWLFDIPLGQDTASDGKAGTHYLPVSEKQWRRSFGEKLDAAMELLELSNIRLAQQISTDPSAISRLRRGIRRPKPPVDQLLVKAILERAKAQNATGKLAKLCGVPAEDFHEEAFFTWLYEGRNYSPVYSAAPLDGLLDSIEHFTVQGQQIPPEPDSLVADDVLNSGKSVYWGTDGLREAVIRFLGSTVREGGELLLYSDQDICWMVDDPEFQARWASLMAACVRSGVQIKIIHNTDRAAPEMLSAIQSWLPLYMSGMIQPYVCRLGVGKRFSKTIFLRAGGACIRASCLRGKEDEGWSEYLTDKRMLDAVAGEFSELLKNCDPLVNIYTDATAPFEAYKPDEHIRLLSSNLSLAYMPEDILRGIMKRHRVSGADVSRLENARAAQAEWLKERLAEVSVREFVTLPDRELLSRGAVRVNLAQSLYDGELFYTPEEYAAHVGALLGLLQNSTNFDAVILPKQPFAQIRIMAADRRVSVLRAVRPYIDFVFSEQRLIKAFHEYFDMLARQYQTDRDDVVDKLMRYI